MQNGKTTTPPKTQPKIVIIGAASASFGPSTLATLIREPALAGSRLALVDLNEASLAVVSRVAERMSDAWSAGISVSATTDRREALEGADFVIVSIEVQPREVLWRLDWEVTTRHGLRQPYAENGGPGGLMHAMRQIPAFIEIARDMESLCPDAWLINFSNPLPRITRAITKYSRIKTVGRCHQINVGYATAAVLLRDRYGLSIPPDVNLHSDPSNSGNIHTLAAAGRRYVSITSAGLNHFIWLLDIRDRQTGEDLYPALRAAANHAPSTLEPFSIDLFRATGYCPLPGDTHLVEYLPYLHDPVARPWETYQVPLYDWSGNEGVREALLQMMQNMADGKLSVDGMKGSVSEGAEDLVIGIGTGREYYDETVNVPNRGAISNLPAETIVEVPAMVGPYGIRPVQVGDLPRVPAELCRREAELVEVVVDAAVKGDRQLALEALLLDPMVNDLGRARAILDDYLRTFADYLPQF